MKAQALCDLSMLLYMALTKTLELNPSNAIVKELKQKVAEDKADKSIHNLTFLLFKTALLTSSFALDEPTLFAKRRAVHHTRTSHQYGHRNTDPVTIPSE